MPPARRSVKILDDDDDLDETGAADLNQTAEEKRNTRKKIQDITSRLDIYIKKNRSPLEDAEFKELLEDAKKLESYIKTSQEQLEDVKLFHKLCKVVSDASCSMDGNEKKFSSIDYCTFLARRMNLPGDIAPYKAIPLQLINFGKEMSKNFDHAPTLTFMLGALHDDESAVASAQRRVKKKAVQNIKSRDKQVATKTSSVSKHQTNEALTDNYVKITRKAFFDAYKQNKSKPLCYFSFVIDPDYFASTVENMFHVSFLVKQRVLKLSIDNRGLPILSPICGRARDSISDEEEEQGGDMNVDHAVIDICHADWLQLKKNLKVTRRMIELPDRKT